MNLCCADAGVAEGPETATRPPVSARPRLLSSGRLDHGEPRNGFYLALVVHREVALAQFADRASMLITNHRWNQQFRHLDMQRDSAGGNLPRRRNVKGSGLLTATVLVACSVTGSA